MLKKIYTHEIEVNKDNVLSGLKNWYESSYDIKFWIVGYCVYKYLAQVYNVVDFNKWNEKKSFYDNQ